MVAQAQREMIGLAARQLGVGGGKRSAGHRQAEVVAACRRLVGGPGDFELVLVRDGARRPGEDRAEAIERGVVGPWVWR